MKIRNFEMSNLDYQKNLKGKQYYSDLYDRITVERCRDIIRLYSTPIKNPPLIKGKKPTQEMLDGISKMSSEMGLWFEKGDRYAHKEETIAKWMAADKAKDDLCESAMPPADVRCLKCGSKMNILDKSFWDGGFDKPDRVFFMFDCPNGCLPRRAFFNNGEEWRSKPNPCPKCGQKLIIEDKDTKTKFITEYKCNTCGYSKTEEIARTISTEKPDTDFVTDRDRFCFSKEAGEKWREELVNLEQMKKLVDKWDERDKNKELYDKVAKIKKLNIAQLKDLITPVAEKSGYTGLEFEKPVIDRHLVIMFTIQDSMGDRAEYDSKIGLRKLIEQVLTDTSWRLMSDGISYRLGILSGNLRAYETEEELLKLVNVKP